MSSRSKIGRSINPRKVVSPGYGEKDQKKEKAQKEKQISVINRLEEVAGVMLSEFDNLKHIIELQQNLISSLTQKVDSLDTKVNLMEKRISSKVNNSESAILKELKEVQETLNREADKDKVDVKEEKKGWFK